MKTLRRVIVFDASDIETEGAFWAGLLGGTVHRDNDWHSIVVDNELGDGRAARPEPGSTGLAVGCPPATVHLDLHVDDLAAAEQLATALGASQLQAPQRPADNPDGDEMFAVYASPAGHPFCFGVH